MAKYRFIARLFMIVCAAVMLVGAGIFVFGAFALIGAIFELTDIFIGEEPFGLMVMGIGCLLIGFAVIGVSMTRARLKILADFQ
ncbi:MAG: hypothetical protein LBC09_05095 [Helicobacteraceae bacterium]|jgi:hypothetical protein|nr:hypothetical protein [Helicobacteraceae bacterium]